MRTRKSRQRTSAAGAGTPRASWGRERIRWLVLTQPLDEAPRLILADWLEENGERWERRMAGFIRCQVAGPCDVRVGGLQHPRGVRTAVRAFKPMGLAHELARLHWLGVEAATFRRGLVEHVCLSARAFEHFAGPLFRTFPILDVALADRAPTLDGPPGDQLPAWLHPRKGYPEHSLPRCVWPLLPAAPAVSRPGASVSLASSSRTGRR